MSVEAIKNALEGDMNTGLTAIDRLRFIVGGVPDFDPITVEDAEWIVSALESLQRENEELRLRGDGAANMARQMASDCSNAQKSLAELRSAIDPINELLAHLLSMSAYHISNPPTPDWEFVQVCNGDLRKMIELSDAAEYALASTGGEHHAE